MIPTPKDIQIKITEFTDKNMDRLATLKYRWDDEKKYEDITDYQKVIQSILPTDWVITKMTTRPFGFQFRITSLPANLYFVFAGSTSGGWKRIK